MCKIHTPNCVCSMFLPFSFVISAISQKFHSVHLRNRDSDWRVVLLITCIRSNWTQKEVEKEDATNWGRKINYSEGAPNELVTTQTDSNMNFRAIWANRILSAFFFSFSFSNPMGLYAVWVRALFFSISFVFHPAEVESSDFNCCCC